MGKKLTFGGTALPVGKRTYYYHAVSGAPVHAFPGDEVEVIADADADEIRADIAASAKAAAGVEADADITTQEGRKAIAAAKKTHEMKIHNLRPRLIRESAVRSFVDREMASLTGARRTSKARPEPEE